MKRLTSIRWPWREWPRNRRNDAARAEYATVFGTAAGRRVLADIIRRSQGMPGHELKPILDPMAMAIAQGRRLLAMEVLNLAGFDGDLLPEALAHDRLEEMAHDHRRSEDPGSDRERYGNADHGHGAEPAPVQLDDDIPDGND